MGAMIQLGAWGMFLSGAIVVIVVTSLRVHHGSESTEARSSGRRVAAAVGLTLMAVPTGLSQTLSCPDGYSAPFNDVCGASVPDASALPLPPGWSILDSLTSGGSGGSFDLILALDAPATEAEPATVYEQFLAEWDDTAASDGLVVEMLDRAGQFDGPFGLDADPAQTDVVVNFHYDDYGQRWGEPLIPLPWTS